MSRRHLLRICRLYFCKLLFSGPDFDALACVCVRAWGGYVMTVCVRVCVCLKICHIFEGFFVHFCIISRLIPVIFCLVTHGCLLCRALKTRSNTPKYGLIFHSSFIGRAGTKNKGRISRFLANKCSIASRIDCFAGRKGEGGWEGGREGGYRKE